MSRNDPICPITEPSGEPLFPHRSPRQSSANAACGRFETTPRRAIPKGHTFISRAVPHHEALPTSSSPPLSGHNRPITLGLLVTVAGMRWPVEEDFQVGKDQFGLDHS